MEINLLDVKYKVGDLVCWHTTAKPFMHRAADYRNPGIILENQTSKRGLQMRPPHRKGQDSWLIQWADGKRTTEYQCYLTTPEKYKKIKKNENNT